jgi:hypothetical protein
MSGIESIVLIAYAIIALGALFRIVIIHSGVNK